MIPLEVGASGHRKFTCRRLGRFADRNSPQGKRNSCAGLWLGVGLGEEAWELRVQHCNIAPGSSGEGDGRRQQLFIAMVQTKPKEWIFGVRDTMLKRLS